MIAAEIVEGTGDPAFASRPEEGIIAWNKAAEGLLGYNSRDVLGRPCFRVLAGRDVFGNRYCSGTCALVRMAQKREPIGRCAIRYRHREGRPVLVGVSVLVVPNGSPSKVDLIHILDARRLELGVDTRGPERRIQSPEYSGDRSPGRAPLTRREVEVLRLMAEGFGTRAIAGQLNISVATTRNHIQNILNRLEVHSRLEAVCIARRIDLI